MKPPKGLALAQQERHEKIYFLSPALLMLFLMVFIPLVMLFISSVTIRGTFSWKDYGSLLQDKVFHIALINTLRIAAKVTVFCIFLGVPTAYFISRSSPKLKSFFILLVLFPLLINAVVRSLSWMIILGRKGILNAFLVNIGLIENPLRLLYTEASIVIGSTSIFLPLMIISLIGVMDNIPRETEEAAYSLGASRLQIFLKIILPIASKGIFVGSILVLTASLTAYTTPQLLGKDQLLVLSTLIRQQGLSLGKWGNVAILSLLMFFITSSIIALLSFVGRYIGDDKHEKQ